MKKLKKALALMLALAIVGSTNLGGLENTIVVQAETTGFTVIDGVEWGYSYNSAKKTMTLNIKNGTALGKGTKDVSIPAKINDITVTHLNTVGECNVKSFTIPADITVNNDAFSDATIDTIYYQGFQFTSGPFQKCKVKNLVLDGTKSAYWFAMQNNEYVETVEVKNSDSFEFSLECFAGCKNLKKITVNESVKNVKFGTKSFELCSNLSDINCNASVNATLYQRAFGNCVKLKDVEFNCQVDINASQFSQYGPFSDKNAGGVFFNSFEKETNQKGNTVKKSLIFNKNVTCNDNHEGKYNTEVIQNCSGLTDVVFNDEVTLTDNFFSNCESLTNVEFNGQRAILGNAIFKGIPIETLDFKSYVVSIGETDRTIDTNPFDGCSAKTLIFENIIQTLTIANMPNLETLYLGDTVGFSSSRVPGSDGNMHEIDCGVNLRNCDYLKSIIIYDKNLLFYDDNDALNKKLKYFHINLQNNIPTVYGLGYKDSIDNYVKTWAYTNKLEYKNIVSELKADYDNNNPIIGDHITSADVDTSKMNVTAKLEPVVTTIFNKIGFSDFHFVESNGQGVLTLPLKNENEDENTGFSIGKIPDTLENGCNTVYIYYSGIEKECFIYTEKKKAVSINVNWNETAITDLVSNQPITVTTVASGATITYNDGSTSMVSSEDLVLDKSETTLGDNIFTISLKENEAIKESETFFIKENYITSIKAEYDSKDILYVGDSIDTSRIKLTATYKYNADKTVNRNISFTKISSSQLTTAGDNIITVYYNDLSTQMIISAKVADVQNIYAIFDKQYSYVQGQESVDPKSIAVSITYNDGSTKTGSDINYDYEIIETTATNNTLQVVVKYKGILSNTVDIPITPKEITGIKASTNIASATEGTTLTKTIIDKIELTYNNGKTETLDATTIDYDSLSFNDYIIVANEKNTITVNYAGKSTEIAIVGVSNTITNIYAEYIGSGQTVGTQVPVSDVSVHAVNANGQITNITDGVLLENAIPYNVGPNTVIVHYGSFSCTITVTGLPAPATTSDPSISPDAPEKINTPEPSKTNQPDKTTTPTGTETPNSTTIVPPDTANNAPVVANTSITVKSNNNKIKTATDKTYKVYTNKSVTLIVNGISSSAIKYQVVAKGAKISDTAWKDVMNNKITISKTVKPSIVYIQYTDSNGIIQTIHTNGFTVDKKKATVNIKKNKTYKKGQKIIFKDTSGIKSAKLDGKKVKSGVKVIKKGTHTLIVTDKAGNKTTITFKVK